MKKKKIKLGREDLLEELKIRLNENGELPYRVFDYHVEIIFRTMLDIIKDIILGNMTLAIYGFGTFYIVEENGKRVLKFRISKSLKKLVK